MISIGNIMLLIPGVALTNSLRDMFSGNTISGLMRFIEAGGGNQRISKYLQLKSVLRRRHNGVQGPLRVLQAQVLGADPPAELVELLQALQVRPAGPQNSLAILRPLCYNVQRIFF